MKFETPLIKAKILKRYKRFLADIELDTGEVIIAHVPNTGRMTNCWGENWDAYLSLHDNPKRKLKYTLELTNNGDTFICVNTHLTNKIAKEALESNLIKELSMYSGIKSEQKILDSRLDFYLTQDGLPDAYVEVKNVTLVNDQLAQFPDAVTTRGQKHLQDLIKIKAMGHRAVMLYIINRHDASEFTSANEIDPKYAALLKEAKACGVEILAYQTKITQTEITVEQPVSIIL
jgi:sugar fermentation stimulation protein A